MNTPLPPPRWLNWIRETCNFWWSWWFTMPVRTDALLCEKFLFWVVNALLVFGLVIVIIAML